MSAPTVTNRAVIDHRRRTERWKIALDPLRAAKVEFDEHGDIVRVAGTYTYHPLANGFWRSDAGFQGYGARSLLRHLQQQKVTA